MSYENLEEVWRGDPMGGPWLDELPSLVEACARRWSLTLGEPGTNRVATLTMPAERDGESVVLKIGIPDREGEFEGEALRRLDGNGAVRLFDDDPPTRAMLLERCFPGTPLTQQDPGAALDVLIGLLPRLWIPAGEPFRSLADEAADLIVEMREHWERTGRTVEERLIDAATEAFESLAATQGEQVLVNQDLHADNVLAAEREPWLLIDPKPLAGEREFGIASIVRGQELGHSREAHLHRLDRVTAELGLDRERARMWAVAHTVAWGFDEEPLAGHIEAATWLLDAA
ncbi:MAG: aminoglycoside phosphotransferase family protein [Actinomycetota bacterium]